jgi:hypothetical protein
MAHTCAGRIGDYHLWGVGATTSIAARAAVPLWAFLSPPTATVPQASQWPADILSADPFGFEWSPDTLIAPLGEYKTMFSYMNMVVGASSSDRFCLMPIAAFPTHEWSRVWTYLFGGGIPSKQRLARLGITDAR